MTSFENYELSIKIYFVGEIYFILPVYVFDAKENFIHGIYNLDLIRFNKKLLV